jgi:hypothetical protein
MAWLTIVSVLFGAGALYYAYRQTSIANSLKSRQEKHDREVRDWQLKHESVAVRLSRINQSLMVSTSNGTGLITLYPSLFGDPQLRRDIETYIIEVTDNRTTFTPRRPTPHELQSPKLRETVDKVAAILENCKMNEPALYRHFEG